MILTEQQPIFHSGSNFRRETWGRSDDVRRSIDVLDQVLSEFDDIEPLYADESAPPNHQGEADDDRKVPVAPPPIDRSLKPRNSPPVLPQKSKRKSFHSSCEANLNLTPPKGSSPPPLGGATTNTQRSEESSKRSEVSSHEYQEINNPLCPSAPPKKVAEEQAPPPPSDPPRQRHRSNKEHHSRTDPRGLAKGEMESPLRKSRSGDVSLATEDLLGGRGRKGGKRPSGQRRGRSSERLLDRPHQQQQQFFEQRRMPEMGPIDPRSIDPNFVDPRLLDPRMCDPRLVDPRYFDRRFIDQNRRFIDPELCDPRLMEPPMMDGPMFIGEGPPHFVGPHGPYPMKEPMQFPHLLPLHDGVPGPFSLPPPNAMDFHPSFEYPVMQDPMMPHGPMVNYSFHPMDPRFDGFPPHLNGFDPRLKPIDPAMLSPPRRPHPAYPLDYPVDLPFEFQPQFPPRNFPPRERFSFDEGLREGLAPAHGPRFPGDVPWLPPTPEEARRTIQKIVRTQNQSHNHSKGDLKEARDSKPSDEHKMAKKHGDHRKLSSDSSGTSSPFEDSKGAKEAQCQKGKGTRRSFMTSRKNSETDPGTFKVGEIVRKDGKLQREFGGKETVSLPRFVSGGKDSGFDESPAIEEPSSLTSSVARGGTPVGVGGGFVVAGVFSDSSKMYIPAPPSPTPDYDHSHGISDGDDDSDIPQEPFYVSSKAKKKYSMDKTSSDSNRGSLSEDSLQLGKSDKPKEKRDASKDNSLQTMIAEFHMGLPLHSGREDARFSDDSLEEEESSSNISPSRPSTFESESHRQESMESLISMEGSTTSFDYMSDLHQKHPFGPKILKKNSKLSSPTKENNNFVSSPSPSKNGYQQARDKFSKRNSVNGNENLGLLEGKRNRANSSPSLASKGLDRTISSISSEDSKKEIPKFDTIRHMIKEGLIEGLDETPPDFAPPPPPKMTTSSTSEERSDSGIGSTASTSNRADESGGSDSLSDKLSTTPTKPYKNCSLNDILQRRTSSPPPLPPPRDSSMAAPSSDLSNTQALSRNQSWLFKNKSHNEQIYGSHLKISKEESKKHSNHKSNLSKSQKNEKITHIDDFRRSSKCIPNGARDSVTTQYAPPLDRQEKETTSHILLENTKNLQANKKPKDHCSLICDDQASVSSHGSRSGRFFSRFTESMKSSSRANSPLATKNTTQQRNKKSGTKFHGDFIRAPHHVKGEAPQPPLGRNPPEFRGMPDPSSVVPLTRDGSGRFRSIEDLADIAAGGKSLEFKRAQDDIKKKKKKNATLPPNLTPADMLEQERELRQKQNASDRNKDESDGSKFKFNIFRGFWRRNKYSFDKS